MMLFFNRVMPIAEIEHDARAFMRKVDALPRKLRFLVYAFCLDPDVLAREARTHGVQKAYDDALKRHAAKIVKPRERV